MLAEATNYVHNLINLFTYMCVPNGDANYYLEWWIAHVCKDPQYCSSMTNDLSIIVCSATGESKDAPKFEYSLMLGTIIYIYYEGYMVSITATKSKISPVPMAGMNQGDSIDHEQGVAHE